MDEQTTSILELLYLIRAKNRGELSFAEWRESALRWAAAVILEHEMGGRNNPPSSTPTEPAAQDECPSCQ